jgi:hypothetical protein
MLIFISRIASFHLFPFLGRIFSWKGSSSRVAYRQSGKGKGRILLEAWAIPDLRVFALWSLASCVNSPEVRVETYLAHLQ